MKKILRQARGKNKNRVKGEYTFTNAVNTLATKLISHRFKPIFNAKIIFYTVSRTVVVDNNKI